MKYLVMENHESHSIVMDESGLFHRVANLGYEIGDTVTEPVFMKTPERRKKTDWKRIATVAAIFVCLLLTSVPFINSSTQSDVVVYMSINPQIHLELNEDGKINRLVADNEDGKILLDGYKYRGKSVASVLSELIDRAESLKYLSEGGDIHITVEAADESRAKTVEVDLSQALKDTYVEKYLIKIKANEESFRKIDEVLNSGNSTLPSETEMTSESSAAETYYRPTESYTEATQATESTTESTTAATTESQKATTQPTEATKPAVKPTEKPTEITKPTEPPTEVTTEPTSETEPSNGEDDSAEDGSEDDDFYWPWWPWPFAE